MKDATSTQLKAGAAPHSPRKQAWRFGAAASILLIGVIIVVAVASRLPLFDGGFHVSFALILGVLGTILLGVALMALVFYSDRAGVDDSVVGISADEWTKSDGEP